MSLKQIAAFFLLATACSTSVGAQTNDRLLGTFSNLALSKQSGDLDGYEIVAIPQSDGTEIIFQCAQGAPSRPVLVPVRQTNSHFSFIVRDPENACNGDYRGELTSSGVVLRVGDGPPQTLPRRPSYWSAHPLVDKSAARPGG